MNAKTKSMLIRNYDKFCEHPSNAGLGTVYKDWSVNKQYAYEVIKKNLNKEYISVDLRVTYGNCFFFNCAAIVKDKYNNIFFKVFTAYATYICIWTKAGLVDENGEIFYEF